MDTKKYTIQTVNINTGTSSNMDFGSLEELITTFKASVVHVKSVPWYRYMLFINNRYLAKVQFEEEWNKYYFVSYLDIDGKVFTEIEDIYKALQDIYELYKNK